MTFVAPGRDFNAWPRVMPQRVMIGGALAHHPLGGAGNAWAFLQYVLGFRRLGFDTYYVEHIAADKCIDDDWRPVAFEHSANARFFDTIMQRFDLSGHMALLEWNAGGHVGLTHADVEHLAQDTDLLINLSGRFHLETVLARVRRRLYLDLDPGFVQIWQAQYGVDMNFRGHDVFATVGLNLGAADCPLPTCGLQWHPTLPPVVLSEWTGDGSPGTTYSTVADWRGYSPVQWNGVWYGQKAEEFVRILDLPHHLDVPLELCLAIHPDEPERAGLVDHGWQLVSPREHAATVDTYRRYILGSRGELSAVKHGYAAGRTGWFSDRSACYLAAGRPVVIQETGVSKYLPTDMGFLTFSDRTGAVEAIKRVERDYAGHRAAATAFARQHLDSDRVLTRLAALAGI